MRNLTLGSLFDGSGGFPLSGALNGITPVWASEIEPYPIAVTRSRFPDMRHLGSVTEIDGGKIPPVDVITFGSPCQDMSIAGKRAGMKHEDKGDGETTRSGLFMEAVRIIREMRRATNGKYPTFAVWENVPGAFSSNKGEDFRYVLEAFCGLCAGEEIHVPGPANGKWLAAGEIVGDGWSIAWRVLDAQYWGVPQRRKRIYLVADFAGGRAGKILFERESLRGNPAQGGEAWKEAAGDAGGGVAGGCISFAWANSANAGLADSDDITPTLKSARNGEAAIAFMAGQGAKAHGIGAVEDGSPTLKASPSGLNQCPSIVYPETARTLTAEYDASPCIDRGQNVLCIDCRNHRTDFVSGTLQAKEGGGYSLNYQNPMCYAKQSFGEYKKSDVASSEKARQWKDAEDLVVEPAKPPRKYIVRRMTPLECCRAQGFPDGWGVPLPMDAFDSDDMEFWQKVRDTHAAVMGKKSLRFKGVDALKKWYDGLFSDSTEYKMWGNGIALPCARFVLEGIAEELREVEK